LSKNYTFNQTLAIAFGLATSMWGFTAHAVSAMSGIIIPVYSILVVIVWVLFPFYVMLYRHAFVAGIFIVVLSMCYLMVTPTLLGSPEWYIFERGLYDFTYVVIYIIGIAFIYFAYKSYKELLAKVQ
jgi:hypothetical protein